MNRNELNLVALQKENWNIKRKLCFDFENNLGTTVFFDLKI